MSKRKQTHAMDVDDDGDDDQTPDIIDVNFDYYNVDASNDYHAIQRLFVQLFGPDAEQVQTADLTELVTRVAEEDGVGSTIKTDEEEGSDPYAVLTVTSCRDHPGLQRVTDHVLSRTSTDDAFHTALSSHLKHGHVGLVLSERLVNMPVQVMGPMYKMLSEEIAEAIKEGRGYDFTHYLFVSRVYRLTAEEEEAILAAQRTSKRHKSVSAPKPSQDGVYAFHPEDEAILEYATSVTYAPGGDVDVGVAVAGRAMLVAAADFTSLVHKIEVRCESH